MKRSVASYLLPTFFLAILCFGPVSFAQYSEGQPTNYNQKLVELFSHPEIPGVIISGFDQFKARLDLAQNPEAARVVLAAAERFRSNQKEEAVGGEILKALDASLPYVSRKDQADLYEDLFKQFGAPGGASHLYIRARFFEALKIEGGGLSPTAVQAINWFLSLPPSPHFPRDNSWGSLIYFSGEYAKAVEKIKFIDTPEKLALLKRFDKNGDFRWDLRKSGAPVYVMSLLDLIQRHPEPHKFNAVVAVADLLEPEHDRNSKGGHMAPNMEWVKRDDKIGAKLVEFLGDEIAKIRPLNLEPSLRYDAFATVINSAHDHDGWYMDHNGVARQLQDGVAFEHSTVDNDGPFFNDRGEGVTYNHDQPHLNSLKAVMTLLPAVNKVQSRVDLDLIQELAVRIDERVSLTKKTISPLWGKAVGKFTSEAELLAAIQRSRGEAGIAAYHARKNPAPAQRPARKGWMRLLFGK